MKATLILMLTLFSFSLKAQDKLDNYSFFKLYVTNEKEEVLLVKWNDKWEIVGDRYNDPVSIKEFLNKMAGEMGIKISDPNLCGMYTQRWKGNSSLTIMHYYHAKYADGDLKIPTDCTDIKWFSYEEALKIIPYQNMTIMMREIKNNPGKIIGASFERYKDQNDITQYITLENFHVMN